MALRRHPIRRIGVQPNLFLGGDRELVMFSGLLAAILVFIILEVASVLIGIAFWCTALYVFRKMAQADPDLRSIYQRNCMYRRYYPAQSTPFRSARELPWDPHW